MIAASASGPSVLGISTRYCAPSVQVSFLVREASSMCRDVAGQCRVIGPYVVYQDTRSALIGREHLIVCRHQQFHASSSSKVGGLSFVQVAHNVELLSEIAPAIDG